MKKKVCLVSSDLMGVISNGGVGTSVAELAFSLAEAGHEVDLLFANEKTLQDHCFHWWQAHYLLRGVRVIPLPNPKFSLDHAISKVRISYAVYDYLRVKDYETIIFPEMHGTGFYCFLAKQVGECFQETNLWLMYHGPTLWHLKHNHESLKHLFQIAIDAIERKSIELADKVFFATDHARELAYEEGYLSKDSKTEVALFPFNYQSEVNFAIYKKVDSIVFFGRIETRKGIEQFLAGILAAREVIFENGIKIYLLGNFGVIENSDGLRFINKWMADHQWQLEVVYGKNRDQALKFMSELKPIVVLSSLEETMGYTLLEALGMRAAIVCSDIKAYKDVLRAMQVSHVAQFKKNDPESLANEIKKMIKKPVQTHLAEERCHMVNKRWVQIIEEGKVEKQKSKKTTVNLSLCILSYRRPEMLAEIIEKLSIMEHGNLREILIYDDFSNDKRTYAFLKGIPKKIKDIPVRVFFGKSNRGPSYGRNYLAKHAKSNYLFLLDDDNIPVDDVFVNLTRAVARTGKDVYVSAINKFTDNSVVNENKVWLPVTDDINLNIFFNVIGDANLCVKKSSYLKVGGFDEDLKGREDQEFLIRMSFNGCSYQIIPKPLIKYRIHSGNTSLVTNNPENLKMFNLKIDEMFFDSRLRPTVSIFQNYFKDPTILDTHNHISPMAVTEQRKDLFKMSASLLPVLSRMQSMFLVPIIQVGHFYFMDIPPLTSRSALKKISSSTAHDERVRLEICAQSEFELYNDYSSQATKISSGVQTISLTRFSNERISLKSDKQGVRVLITKVGVEVI